MDTDRAATKIELRLLRNPSFLRLWIAMFLTTVAVYGLGLAGLVLVEQTTHSSAQAGVSILSSVLPAFLGSMIAGAVVDRFGQLRMLRASHFSRAIISLVFWAGTALLPAGLSITAVYVANAAAALTTQFAESGEMALLPDIVGREHLMSANSLFQIARLVGQGLGIVALAPLLVKLAGSSAMGLMSAALCSLALTLISWGLARDKTSTGGIVDKWTGWGSFVSDLQAGWRTIARDRLLAWTIGLATLGGAVLLVQMSMLPGIASRELGIPVENAPLIIIPGGVGFVLGAILVSRWDHWLGRLAWIGSGLLVVGVFVVLLAPLLQADSIFWALGAVLGIGVGIGTVIVAARTTVQERPPAEQRGRVVSAQFALNNATAVLPLILGGLLADRLGFYPVMLFLGLLCAVAGVAGIFLRQRKLRVPAVE